MATLRLRNHEPRKVEKIEQGFNESDLVYRDYVKEVYRDGNRFIKLNRKKEKNG